MPKILISEKVADETIKYLEGHDIEVKKGRGLDHQTICEDIRDCDAVMVRVMKIDRHILENARKLKVIAKHGVGCDSIDCDAAAELGIPVVFAPGSNSLSVAEHTMALILSCAHCIRQANIEYFEGCYNVKDVLAISEISGKTLGLIGCGNVALHVARMARFGFGMVVMGYDPFNRKVIPDYIQMEHSLEKIISRSDFVSLHIPATDENINFFDNTKMTLMKPTAYIINTARGDVLNTQDLIDSIDEKKIAGAGLDVCFHEPADPKSALFKRRNILLTPHIGAASKESMVRMGIMAAEGVVDVLNGRLPKNLYIQNE